MIIPLKALVFMLAIIEACLAQRYVDRFEPYFQQSGDRGYVDHYEHIYDHLGESAAVPYGTIEDYAGSPKHKKVHKYH